MFVPVVLHLVLCYVFVLLQITRCSSKGKDIIIDVPSPVAKRTRRSTQSSQGSEIENSGLQLIQRPTQMFL